MFQKLQECLTKQRDSKVFFMLLAWTCLRVIIISTISIFIMMFGGCSRSIILHPISGNDIFNMPSGSIVQYPDGNKKTTPHDGYYISCEYMTEIMDVAIDET